MHLRRRFTALGGWGFILLSCVPATARTSHDPAAGGNCVAYARDVTGIRIDGNAATWWPHAEGRYERGHKPAIGAILVFKSYGRMHSGHVAVVSGIVSRREILIDHANWVRGRITMAMSVVDSSPDNDWTSVKVLEPHSGTHGRDNPTFGFIYSHALPAGIDRAIAQTAPDRPQRHYAASDKERRAHHVKPPSDVNTDKIAGNTPQSHLVATHHVKPRPEVDTDKVAGTALQSHPVATHHVKFRPDVDTDKVAGNAPQSHPVTTHHVKFRPDVDNDKVAGNAPQSHPVAAHHAQPRSQRPAADKVAFAR